MDKQTLVRLPVQPLGTERSPIQAPFPNYRLTLETLYINWRVLTKARKLKFLNISFPRVTIEPTTCHVYSRTCPTAPRLASIELLY